MWKNTDTECHKIQGQATHIMHKMGSWLAIAKACIEQQPLMNTFQKYNKVISTRTHLVQVAQQAAPEVLGVGGPATPARQMLASLAAQRGTAPFVAAGP